MVREIYIRDSSDPYYQPNVIDYTNEVESVISQVKMILGTTPGDVLGANAFGIDMSYLVFGTRENASQITSKIDEQLSEYLYHSDKITVNTAVNFGNSGKGYDYAVVDIYINGTKAIGFLVDKDNEY